MASHAVGTSGCFDVEGCPWWSQNSLVFTQVQDSRGLFFPPREMSGRETSHPLPQSSSSFISKRREQVLGIFHVPKTMLSTFVGHPFDITATHSTGEETEAQKDSNLLGVTQPVSGRACSSRLGWPYSCQAPRGTLMLWNTLGFKS